VRQEGIPNLRKPYSEAAGIRHIAGTILAIGKK